MSTKDPNLDILNSSGFPFQLRVAEQIRRHPGWEVFAEEHFWRDERTGESGFIDIVAGFGNVRFVIECKRGAGATWIFLSRKSDPEKVSRLRGLCTDKTEGEKNVYVWSDMAATPHCPESKFCVVRGQADKEPMLERNASALVQSVDALGTEELRIGKSRRYLTRMYIPIIVTATTLQLSRFDPFDVDQTDGKLPHAKATFESLPFVRFRKALMSGAQASEAETLQAVQHENERSVLIVQAESLDRLLDEWKLSPELGENWPHTIVRRYMEREKGLSVG